jgi:hypothetical protein
MVWKRRRGEGEKGRKGRKGVAETRKRFSVKLRVLRG